MIHKAFFAGYKKFWIVVIGLYSVVLGMAQSGQSTFDFLLLPASVRASALGGNNVSTIAEDVSLVYNNPAFLGQESDQHLNFSYLLYLADIGFGNVTYAKSANEYTTWGVGVNYAHYGKMLKTTEDNQILGDLSANDICGNFFISRDLSEKIRGGVTAKFIYSNYDEYTAFGLGVDLGLSYYDEEKEFSAGLVGKNIGRQIKAYAEETAALPWDIQLGISKKLAHAPFRISLTGVSLKQWKFDNINGKEDSFLKTFLKHWVIGIEAIPSDNLWIGVGYNIKRGSDLHLQEGNKLGGFSIGAGLKVKSFDFGCSYGQYFPSVSSLMFTVSTSLAEMKL
jgi:hypothetical protein